MNLQMPSQCRCLGHLQYFQVTYKASGNPGAGLLSVFETESGLVFGVRQRALRLWDLGAGTSGGYGMSLSRGTQAFPRLSQQILWRSATWSLLSCRRACFAGPANGQATPISSCPREGVLERERCSCRVMGVE